MLDALSPGYFPAPPVQQPQTPQLGQGRGVDEDKSQSDDAKDKARTNGGLVKPATARVLFRKINVIRSAPQQTRTSARCERDKMATVPIAVSRWEMRRE